MDAYADGYRAGMADRLLGRRSEYAWVGVNDSPGYSFDYARGYRAAWK